MEAEGAVAAEVVTAADETWPVGGGCSGLGRGLGSSWASLGCPAPAEGPEALWAWQGPELAKAPA